MTRAHPTHASLPDGLVFDLDGTIVDNMPVHAEAFALFSARHGLPPMTAADRHRLDGRRNRDIFPDLFGRPLGDDELAAYADEKETFYRELSPGRLTPLAGLLRLIDAAGARGVAVAIATSAPVENVEHTLAELGLANRWAAIARSDQVARGKPFPDVFLAAATRIGVAPERCVAFEDAPAGITAARAAGMTAVAVTTSFPSDLFLAHPPGPHFAVADFEGYLAGPGAAFLRG